MKLTFLLALFSLLLMLLISWYQQHIRRNVYHTEKFCVPVHVDGNSANTHPSSRIKESFFSRISEVNAKWLVRLLLNHSTTLFLFLIRLFFVRDVNGKNNYKYRFFYLKKIQKDIRNALTLSNKGTCWIINRAQTSQEMMKQNVIGKRLVESTSSRYCCTTHLYYPTSVG